MRKFKGTFLTFLTQQSGQIQLLIVAPILTLSFLSLVVRTASSAVDSSIEKKKVTEQLKRRLSEVQNEQPILIEWREAVSPLTKIPFIVHLPHQEKELVSTALQEDLTNFSPQQIFTPALAQQLLPPLQVSVKVRKKMTLSSILESEGVGKEEGAAWLVAIKKQKALQKLAAGRTIDFSFVRTKEGDGRELRSIAYPLDKRSRLILERQAKDTIVARTEMLPVSLVWKGIGGRIIGSLYTSAIKAGVPQHLIDDIADMDWDLNLSSDLRQGDIFKVIFEEFHLEGKPIDSGRLIAAQIINKGKIHTHFSIPEPKDLMVPANGTGKNKTFLRYPLKFTRITSVFTDARLHPILERVRPHTGVDFAAPRGTPVRSISDGKVTSAGRESGYGITVRIDHPGPYDSAYAHLDRIATGVKEGKPVEKGQVIGFVGSTGLATGPHLHFEMYKNGAFINPLTAKIAREDSFQKKENPVFSAKKQQVLTQLSAMNVKDQPVVLSMAVPGQSDSRSIAKKDGENRLAMANSPSLVPGLVSSTEKSTQKKASVAKTSRSKSSRSRVSSSKRSKSSRARR